MAVFLIGGGWDPAAGRALYGAFLAAAAGPSPSVACVVLDEGDGQEQFARFAAALTAAGPCAPVPVLIPLGGQLDVGSLADADALLVCGGLTPAYADALAPAAADLRAWRADGNRPYAGFSAGAAVAARTAVVGGWRLGGVQICPEDAGEDLDDLRVTDGLGLVPFAVDVHCAQWGTLGRLVAAVGMTDGLIGVGLDENTMLSRHDDDGAYTVSGLNQAWMVEATDRSVQVSTVRAGGRLEFAHRW